MLTDDEIKALREKSQYTVGGEWPDEIFPIRRFELNELCTRLLSAEARVKVLEEALRAIPEELDDQNYHDVYAIVRTALQEQSK